MQGRGATDAVSVAAPRRPPRRPARGPSWARRSLNLRGLCADPIMQIRLTRIMR